MYIHVHDVHAYGKVPFILEVMPFIHIILIKGARGTFGVYFIGGSTVYFDNKLMCITFPVTCICISLTVQDWEIIEPASFDQLGGSTTIHCTAMGGEGEELRGRGSPRTVARERWRRAIEQQIMLQRMEKQNQTIISKTLHEHTCSDHLHCS